MCAVAEDRQPENSAADAAASVALVLAARESAERGGSPGAAVGGAVSDARGRRRRRGRRSTRRRPASTPRAGRAGAPPTWYAAAATGRARRRSGSTLMRFRPGTPVAADGAAGRGPARRRPRHRRAGAVLRRRPSPVDVPTIRATLVERRLVVARDRRRSTSTEHPDAESALAAYADAFAAPGCGARPRRAAGACGAPGTATSRRSPPPTSLENLATSTSTTCRSTWCRSTTAGAPAWGRGCGRATGSGRWPRVVDAVRASGRRAGIWLAPFVVGARHHAGARAPRLAGRRRRPQLGPAPGRPRPDPPGRPGAAGRGAARGWSTWASTTSSSTSSTRARCPGRRHEDVTRWPPTARAWRWSARWSDRTSTWWAAGRRSCRASGWSTRCGSRRTPSTRAARTAPPACAG